MTAVSGSRLEIVRELRERGFSYRAAMNTMRAAVESGWVSCITGGENGDARRPGLTVGALDDHATRMVLREVTFVQI